jgi:hypothetical protein
LQAASDGAAIIGVVERTVPALDIVQQALLLGPQLLVALLQPPRLHVVVAQMNLHHMCHDEASEYHALAGQRNLAAGGDSAEATEQHETYQSKLVPEP